MGDRVTAVPGTLDLAGHRAANTMQARGDSTLLSNGGRLKSVLVNTHALTVEGKLETGSLNMQNGGDLKLLKGGSISLESKSGDEEPVWEKKASLAVLGEAEQATLHNVQIQGYSWFMGESAERSRIDDIDFTTEQNIEFRNLTIGADNSFTTTAKDGAITLWNDVTIDLSDATYQLLKDVLFPTLNLMHDCLKITRYMLDYIEVNENILDSDLYQHLFTVEEVNRRVLNGVPFRDAYRQVGIEVNEGRFQYEGELEHTHIGSIGNL